MQHHFRNHETELLTDLCTKLQKVRAGLRWKTNKVYKAQSISTKLAKQLSDAQKKPIRVIGMIVAVIEK